MGDVHWHVSTGTTVCPECGADPANVHEPSLGEQFAYRMRLGMRLAPLLTCPDGHEWRAGSHTRMTLRTPSPLGRAIRVPSALIGTVRRGRRMEPVPLTYLMAAGLGLVVGVIMDLVLGWPWWWVAIAVMAMVWLFFMSTAFWGPFRLTRHDFMDAVAPQRAQVNKRNRLAAAVEAGESVLFALADWPGEATLAGWGGSAGHTISLTLRFGGEEQRIEVQTSSPLEQRMPATLQMENLADNLLGGLEQPPPDLTGDEWHNWSAARGLRIQEQLLALHWVRESFVVDGVEVPADFLRLEDATSVFIRLDDCDIGIESYGVDLNGRRLIRVSSLQPFLSDV
ncbi:MAG: hypothetical protein QNL12_05175 [Acidimicrobiia bacterium]|nr:hypothetical protein [Acidimicrobiia bacterium]